MESAREAAGTVGRHDLPRERDRLGTKRGADDLDHSSPTKRQGHVDITTLRELLAEQSNMILEAQRIQIAKAMDDQEAKVEGRFQAVDRKFDAQDDKMAKIETQLADLAKELREAPKSTTASTGGRDLPDKYRWTLVYGGWERDTRKGTTLRQLDQVLSQLQVDAELDGRPWTSGARRSNAFSNFQPRRGEREHEARDRMQKIILAFADKKPTVGGRRLFATWSKPPEERRRGAHCSLVKKLVGALDERQVEMVDLERQSGSAWLGDAKIACATAPLAEESSDFYVFGDRDQRPWINVAAIAREIKVDKHRVMNVLLQTLR